VSIHIPWLSSARRLLSRQVDRLQQTLTSLGQALRDRIAQAVGQSVSRIVREAVHAVLEQLHGDPGSRRLLPEATTRTYDPGGLFSHTEPPDDRFLDDDFRDELLDQDSCPDAEPAQPPRPLPRWGSFLAAVLQTLAWWLRRGVVYPWLTAGVVGVVGVAFFLGCPLLGTGIGIVRSASDLLALVKSTATGAGTLAGWLAR
jgi:hypothetical protein